MKMSERNKRGVFVSVDINNESYRFNYLDESEIPIQTNGQNFRLSPEDESRTRTAERLKKVDLWQW